MIKRIYQCDLCHENAEGKKGWRYEPKRLKYEANGISLRPLADNAASETVICGECLDGLAKALEVAKP